MPLLMFIFFAVFYKKQQISFVFANIKFYNSPYLKKTCETCALNLWITIVISNAILLAKCLLVVCRFDFLFMS